MDRRTAKENLSDNIARHMSVRLRCKGDDEQGRWDHPSGQVQPVRISGSLSKDFEARGLQLEDVI